MTPEISLGTSTALWKNIILFISIQPARGIYTVPLLIRIAHPEHLAIMAPTFDTLSDHDFDDVDEEEIDFSGKIAC